MRFIVTRKSHCPPGTTPGQGGCVALEQPIAISRPPAGDAEPQEELEHDEPGLSIPDARSQRRSPRARALLVTELQQLERLIASSPSAPGTPALLRRLAETYGELEARASHDEAQAKPGDATGAARARKLREACSDKVLALYVRLLREYPASPGIDEVLYYLAVELGLRGKTSKSRATLRKLVQEHPDSALVSEARAALEE